MGTDGTDVARGKPIAPSVQVRIPGLKVAYRIDVRWMTLRDLVGVAKIEQLSFGDPWSVARLQRLIGSPGGKIIGMVARRGDRVVGYMLWRPAQRFGSRSIELIRLAVHPRFRGCGIGRAMVGSLRHRLSPARPALTIPVREENLGAQKFLRALEIPARTVIPAYYEDTGSDAYLFEYRLPSGAAGGMAG